VILHRVQERPNAREATVRAATTSAKPYNAQPLADNEEQAIQSRLKGRFRFFV
jgi:hypothetical protein